MQTEMPLISVLLPVYNGEKTLEATLLSLINQTYDNFEILIGIDGTKDQSKNIALSFNDKRIKIFEHPINIGLANNLNNLIQLSSTDSLFFAMAEQDDVYVENRFKWQVEVLQNKLNVGLVSGIIEFKSKYNSVLFPWLLVNNEQFPKGKDMFLDTYIYQLKVVNTCMMWRKSVHQKEELFFRNDYGNFNIDWDFVLRASLVTDIYGITRCLGSMKRGVTNDSITRNRKQQHIASRRLLKKYREEFSNLISNEHYKKAFKHHRKVELGHHSKLGILFYGVLYFIMYLDFYFIHYIKMRITKYLSKVNE